jgi:hypothetical protein
VDHDKAFGAATNLARDLNVPIRMIVDQRTVGDDPPLNPRDAGIQFNSYKGLVHWVDPVNELADLGVWIKDVLPMSDIVGQV